MSSSSSSSSHLVEVGEEHENEDEDEPATLNGYPARSFISKSLLSTVSPTGTKI